eukprot:4290944-Pyramimonas_sp.AAC.1
MSIWPPHIPPPRRGPPERGRRRPRDEMTILTARWIHSVGALNKEPFSLGRGSVFLASFAVCLELS